MVFCAPGISIRCLVLWIFFSSCIFLNNASIFDFDFQQIRSKSNQDSEEEKNKYSAHQVPDALKDALHGVKMGIPSSLCDNAKDDLYMDWGGSPLNYTCYHPKNPLPVDDSLKAIESCDVPKNYVPKHKCMKENIHYNVSVPTYGDHRPLWPVYGEYLFVPPQRWLHSVEHGAIVMLYNPCAQPLEVERLRLLVRGCLRRHIITPYSLLPKERPLALIAWGCKLLMNYVEEDVVIQFIRRHALHGPEGHLAKQGIYNFKLLNMAFAPQGSNYNDQHLCPQA